MNCKPLDEMGALGLQTMEHKNLPQLGVAKKGNSWQIDTQVSQLNELQEGQMLLPLSLL